MPTPSITTGQQFGDKAETASKKIAALLNFCEVLNGTISWLHAQSYGLASNLKHPADAVKLFFYAVEHEITAFADEWEHDDYIAAIGYNPYSTEAAPSGTALAAIAFSGFSALAHSVRSLFIELANDACNWNGQPLYDGDKSDKSDNARLTHLKIAGLVTTVTEEKATFVCFTAKGREVAAAQGIDQSAWTAYSQ